MSDPALAQVEITFPEEIWLAAICKEFPSTRIEIQSFLPGRPTDAEKLVGNALMRISGTNYSHALDAVNHHPSLVELFVLDKDRDGALVNVKTKDRWLLGSLIKSEIVLRFPVHVKWNGELERTTGTWVITDVRHKIDELLVLLEKKGVEFQLKSISSLEAGRVTNALTPRQAEILDEALAEGYFEIPRRITLTALAEKVGVAKSTLSGLLRRISQKMLVR